MSAQAIPRAQFRMNLMQAVFLAVGLVLGARLFFWQIINWDALSQRALDQQINEEPIRARRGDIKTNDGLMLASETHLYTIRITPPRSWKPEKIQQLAKDLAPILGQTYDWTLAKVMAKEKIVTLAQNAPAYIGEAARAYANRENIWQLEIKSKPTRQYPHGAFAAQTIGFVYADGKAAYGVEQAMDRELRGVDGKRGGTLNAYRDGRIPIELPEDTPAQSGAEVTLAINSRIQRIIEAELEKVLREARAPSGTVIVMEPKTGAILGLANYPTADLNAFANLANGNKYNNPAVSGQYEPGSIFKMVTVACALDAGTITANTVFDDNGVFYLGGREIRNPQKIVPGRVTLVDVFKLSLNVEAAKIAVGLGTEKFYQCVRNFGFGNLTRIELASEATGEVKAPGDGRWRDIDLGTNAFGQGIAVTPLQAITAFAAVANQGKLMRPHIIRQVRFADGRISKTMSENVRSVVRPATAALVTELLAQAIGAESSNKALVQGYRIAGKTGTASVPIPGGHDPNATIATFVGYLPADDPRVVILVKLDKPQSSEWASQVASPVFASLAKQLAVLMGIPPDEVRAKIK